MVGGRPRRTRGRRETPQLEFKEALELRTETQREKAEHAVQGLADAGGGILIYGVSEVGLDDGSKVAGDLTPLKDGGLYEQLNNVLDGRGDPKVPFDLHAIEASSGGIYLVVDVYGRRRPHMANDKRFYLRRNLQVRTMTESEVAEAYEDRFARERSAAISAGAGRDVSDEEIEARVHRGLTPGELEMYIQETGNVDPPGWLSVVAYPDPPQPNLLDPTKFDRWTFHEIAMEDRWRYNLQPDGVFEFGDLLEDNFRGTTSRSIPSRAVAEYVHDALLLFARIYSLAGYDGPVAAYSRVDHVRGYQLAVDPRRYVDLHPIKEAEIVPDRFRGDVDRLERVGAAAVARQLCERIFLAAGSTTVWFFDGDGNYIGDD